MGENGYIDFVYCYCYYHYYTKHIRTREPLQWRALSKGSRSLHRATGRRAGTGTGTGTGEIDLTCVHDSARGRAVQSVCQFDPERERRGFSNLVYGIWYAAFWGRR